MAAATYERVTFKPEGGRPRSVLLMNPRVAGPLLVGVEVDRYGDEVQPSKAVLKAENAEYGTKLHVLSLDLVAKREPMVMDNRYAWLVPAGTATQEVE